MKNSINMCIFALMVILLFTTNDSFAIQKHLKTEAMKDTDITGVFTLILYGGRHSDDIETIVILDKEGDRYDFEPYAPEYDYKIKRGISDREALDEAERFVSWHPSFHRSQLSRIIDEKGNTIGYELRPLYMPLTFGVSDVLDVDYRIKDGKVIITIKLIPSVEKMLRDGDGLKNRSGN
ncbi:MAG: hypothetical protein HZC12_08465 [Nitrospirae bacterium]|nr:hypothetical protein [Nitrospirota bacterium]